MTQHTIPIAVTDPINEKILAVSEDQIQGFVAHPFAAIAQKSGVPLETVLERIAAMLQAGVIRRVRQTILATSLAQGALVVWQVPQEKLESAFTYMATADPFSGHVVIRSADPATPGSRYKLWTTLKVPQGFSLDKHCQLLMRHTGATAYRLMPAKKMFTLGVGHTRRRHLEPGSKTDVPGEALDIKIVQLDELEWRVLDPLKRELSVNEITADPWRLRAAEAGVDLATFHRVARSLGDKGVVGRFSTFLEHVKKVAGNDRVTRFNALFHWAVPKGMEMAAGRQVGRFHCMTHAYWRESGPEFRNVNIMGVIHGMDKQLVFEHKAAIDAHLARHGIEVTYTNVFWGGRSEIKPSEIMPQAYRTFCRSLDVDPQTMRA